MKPDTPNLIFLHVDQMSLLDSIAALGAPHVRTPGFDRLVGEGYRFLRSTTPNPVCGPARACWWTGRHASEHGGVVNNTDIHSDLPLLPDHLRAHGIDPFFIGKWHVDGRPVRESFHVLHEGGWWGEYTDTDCTRSAVNFLAHHPGDRPFFLTIGYLNPHDICISPCHDAERSRANADGSRSVPYLREGLLPPETIPPPPDTLDIPSGEPALQVSWNRWAKDGMHWESWDEEMWRFYRHQYHRWVEMVDGEITVLLDALERSRFCDNTLIVFTSDHGDGMGRHRVIGKTLFYRDMVEVPLVVASLGNRFGIEKGGCDSCHLVNGIDLARTFCDYAGVPADPFPRGHSLRPLVEKRDPPDWRRQVYAECAFHARMLETADWKYIRGYALEAGDFRQPRAETHAVESEQLFNLKTDPNETVNHAADPGCAGVLAELREALEAEERAIPAGRPVTDPRGQQWIRTHWSKCVARGRVRG